MVHKLITGDKYKHITGVAEYMYEHADEFGLSDTKEQLYVVGLLHSVGAIRMRNKDDKDSVDILRMLNFPQFYMTIIESNSICPEEYKKKYGVSDEQIPKAQILMWKANMIIDFDGNECDILKRVEQIEKWHIDNGYIDNHSARKTMNWLLENGYL